MWRPPAGQRVKHGPPDERSWPTADEAAQARLFAPLTLPSGLTLSSRAWVPAMVPWRASDEGEVTPAVIDWYRRFAEGRPAVVVVEATGIRDVASGPLLRAGHPRYLDGLKRLVDAVGAVSRGRTRLFIQLIDFLKIRRRPSPKRYFEEFLTLTTAHREALGMPLAPDAALRATLLDLPDEKLRHVLTHREYEALTMGARSRVTDLDDPEIAALPSVLPARFAEAAARCKAAGFDGVELHYAHAYTMASFLSALNTRGDGWGATLEGRLRLPLAVLDAVRAAVGADFTVGARMLCDDVVEGGTRPAEAATLALALARAGLDFLSLSTGGRFEDAAQPREGEAAYPYTGQSGYECMPGVVSDARGPYLRNIAKQAMIRAHLRAHGVATPVVAAGGIATFADAEGILARGEADLIGAARQSLADPDWWEKIRQGRARAVRRCLFSNYCEALDQRHKAVTCQQWDRLALDAPDVTLSFDRRRRLTAPRSW